MQWNEWVSSKRVSGWPVSRTHLAGGDLGGRRAAAAYSPEVGERDLHVAGAARSNAASKSMQKREIENGMELGKT